MGGSAIDDLRGYIAALDDAGALARIDRSVSLDHELADVAAALERADAGAGLFTAVEGSPWPVFSGGVASRRRAAIALGCEPRDVVDVMALRSTPPTPSPPCRPTTPPGTTTP